jgi:hypothetical protein
MDSILLHVRNTMYHYLGITICTSTDDVHGFPTLHTIDALHMFLRFLMNVILDRSFNVMGSANCNYERCKNHTQIGCPAKRLRSALVLVITVDIQKASHDLGILALFTDVSTRSDSCQLINSRGGEK